MPKKRQADADTSPAPVAEVVAPVVRQHEIEPHSAFTREYPEEVKEEFFRRTLEKGENVSLVCRDMGIPKGTVENWIAELKEEREPQIELENIRLVDLLGKAGEQLLAGLSKANLAKASVRDLAVAIGIVTDKRRDLLGPRKGSAISRLRIAWKDGSGAVEVETGGG